MNENTTLNMKPNIEAMLAYSIPVLSTISGIVIFILEKENKFVRFHAMQSFIVMTALSIIQFVAYRIILVGGLLGYIASVVCFASWLIMIVNAYLGKEFKYPVVGEAIYEQVMK